MSAAPPAISRSPRQWRYFAVLGFLQPSSIRGRLTLQYTLAFSIILMIGAGSLYGVLSWIIYRDIDSELQDEAQRVAKYIRFEGGKFVLRDSSASGDDSDQSYDLATIFRIAQISDAHGEIVKQSLELTTFGYSLQPSELQRMLAQRPTVYTWPGGQREEEIRFANAVIHGPDQQPYLLQIGTRLKPINDTLDTFLWVLLGLLPMVIGLSAVAGSITAKRTLKPVADIAHAAQFIGASNLNQRLPTRAKGDELDELADTFNAMIARIEESFIKMSEFAANVSHELRTPLQAMQGETELALLSEAPLTECRRVLESNLEEIDRLNRMIRNLLVLAQADAGEVKPRLELMDLNELVRDIVEQMQVVAGSRDIQLRALTAGPVPVRADALRMRQMMLNLIDNALKYTPSGGAIEVRVDRQHTTARVRVRDTGVGIGPDDLPHIFERFYRADKSRTRDGNIDGCGLGLPIVKWVAEIHGGQVEVTSSPGKGSTFTVTLPMAGAA